MKSNQITTESEHYFYPHRWHCARNINNPCISVRPRLRGRVSFSSLGFCFLPVSHLKKQWGAHLKTDYVADLSEEYMGHILKKRERDIFPYTLPPAVSGSHRFAEVNMELFLIFNTHSHLHLLLFLCNTRGILTNPERR